MAKQQHNIQGVNISDDLKTLSIITLNNDQASMLYPLLNEPYNIKVKCNVVKDYIDIFILQNEYDYFELNYDLTPTTKQIAYAIDLNLIEYLLVTFQSNQQPQVFAKAIPLSRN